jgi:hypothetical protein
MILLVKEIFLAQLHDPELKYACTALNEMCGNISSEIFQDEWRNEDNPDIIDFALTKQKGKAICLFTYVSHCSLNLLIAGIRIVAAGKGSREPDYRRDRGCGL